MLKATKLTPPPVCSLTAHLRPGPESVRDAPQRWSQSRVVAQQHGGHVGIVYPLYPYLGVGMLVVVGREKAVAVEPRDAINTKIRNAVSLNANPCGGFS